MIVILLPRGSSRASSRAVVRPETPALFVSGEASSASFTSMMIKRPRRTHPTTTMFFMEAIDQIRLGSTTGESALCCSFSFRLSSSLFQAKQVRSEQDTTCEPACWSMAPCRRREAGSVQAICLRDIGHSRLSRFRSKAPSSARAPCNCSLQQSVNTLSDSTAI